jgi:hypothetical protein
VLTLARARLAKGSAGEPLPTVFRSLAADGVHIRRGQVSLIAAAPGVGKSLFALAVVLTCASPGLYFSADTDAYTMYVRSGAMLTGWQTTEVETAVEYGNTATIDAHLEALTHVRFDFSGRIDVDVLEEELKAYASTYGEWPHVIVVDNLSNLDLPDAAEGYLALEQACDYLHEMARTTGAAVVALHHVIGAFDDGLTAVPMSGLRGKISKVPELILTLYRDASTGTEGLGRLFVCPVKNRTGRADPGGGWAIPLHYQPHRMTLKDIPMITEAGKPVG